MNYAHPLELRIKGTIRLARAGLRGFQSWYHLKSKKQNESNDFQWSLCYFSGEVCIKQNPVYHTYSSFKDLFNDSLDLVLRHFMQPVNWLTAQTYTFRHTTRKREWQWGFMIDSSTRQNQFFALCTVPCSTVVSHSGIHYSKSPIYQWVTFKENVHDVQFVCKSDKVSLNCSLTFESWVFCFLLPNSPLHTTTIFPLDSRSPRLWALDCSTLSHCVVSSSSVTTKLLPQFVSIYQCSECKVC